VSGAGLPGPDGELQPPDGPGWPGCPLGPDGAAQAGGGWLVDHPGGTADGAGCCS